MGNELSKIKNSKRRHKDESAIQRQVKIAKTYGHSTKYIDEPHRLIKHHAMNCGNPKCIFCSNPRKTFKEITLQEKRFLLQEDSEIHEIGDKE